MNPNAACALAYTPHGMKHGRYQTVARFQPRNLADIGLARNTEQHGVTQSTQFADLADESQILFLGLAKTNPRIQPNVLLGESFGS
jgi:hypothetical protein